MVDPDPDPDEESESESGSGGSSDDEEMDEEEEAEEEEEEEAAPAEGSSTANTRRSSPMQRPSPPGSGPGSGMRLRSGRKKKRRRSREHDDAAGAGAGAGADGGGGTAKKRAAAAGYASGAGARSAKKQSATGTGTKRKRSSRRVRIAGQDDHYSSSSSSSDSDGNNKKKGSKDTGGGGGGTGNAKMKKPAAKRRRRSERGTSAGADGAGGDDEKKDEVMEEAAQEQSDEEEMDDAAKPELLDGAKPSAAVTAASTEEAAIFSPPADRTALAEAAGTSMSPQLPQQQHGQEDGTGSTGEPSPLQSVSLQLPPRSAVPPTAAAAAAAAATAAATAAVNGTASPRRRVTLRAPLGRPSDYSRADSNVGASAAAAAAAAAVPTEQRRRQDEGEEGREDTESSPDRTSGRRDPTYRRFLRRASSLIESGAALIFTDTIRATTEAGRIADPEAVRRDGDDGDGAALVDRIVVEEDDKEEDGEKEAAAAASAAAATASPHRRSDRTLPWLVAFLVLHTVVALLSGGVVVRPLWSSIPETSTRRLHWYRSLLGYTSSSNYGDVVDIDVGTGRVENFTATASTSTGMDGTVPEDDGSAGEDEIEKVVEEIVIEEEPDVELYEKELQARKDRLIAEHRKREEEQQELHEQKDSDDVRLREITARVATSKKEAFSLAAKAGAQVKPYKKLVTEAEAVVAERNDMLDEWESALEEAERAMKNLDPGLAGANGAVGHSDKAALTEALESLGAASVLPVTASLFDAKEVRIPGEECDGMDYVPIGGKVGAVKDTDSSVRNQVEEDAEDAPLLMSDLEQAKEGLMELADSTAKSIMDDTGIVAAVRLWIKKQINDAGLDLSTIDEEDDRRQGADKDEISAQDVRKLIDRRLGLEMADGNGKFDYAAIRAGATVVRVGPRHTTPSLKDNLPLLNRLLAAAKLRFYGHPPEAALNPTFPRNALGQCWAFEAGKKPTPDEDDDDDPVGIYGTLTVNLAEPVEIKSVSVEHAPRDLSPTPETALRDFRVAGYEALDAKGKPWQLGSFRYEIDGQRTLQEFVVDTEDEETPLPLMRSVTLAIDSNWGADYCCLYRFRVHGDRLVPLPQLSLHSSCTEEES